MIVLKVTDKKLVFAKNANVLVFSGKSCSRCSLGGFLATFFTHKTKRELQSNFYLKQDNSTLLSEDTFSHICKFDTPSI